MSTAKRPPSIEKWASRPGQCRSTEGFERPGVFDDCPVTADDRLALFEGLLSTCRWCEVFFLWRPNLPDEGDNHVVELAVPAGAGTVVTHTVVDLRGELPFPGVEVLRPKDLLKLMR
jgi:hypothetical protein